MRTVIRPLVPRMEYGLRLDSRRIPYSFFWIILLLLSSTFVRAQRGSVSCHTRVNISINSGHPTKLGIEALTPMSDLTDVIVELTDRDQLVFTCADVDEIIMAAIIDTMINQRCMVEILVENKTPLEIMCRDTALTCIEGLSNIAPDDLIIVTSSCDDLVGLDIAAKDSDPITYDSDSDTLEYFVRTWSVTDKNGNILQCESTIYLTRLDLLSIEFPENITIFCGQNAADTSITGGVNFDPILLANSCQVAITCTLIDTIKSPCVDSFKIIKEWVAIDWTNMERREVIQYIYVKDTTPISLTAPGSFTILQDSCDFKIILEEPTINSSECANVTKEDLVVYVDNQLYNIGDTIPILVGIHELIYRGGTAACNALIEPDTTTVNIVDMVAPIIECDSVKDLAITLIDGMSTWIDLDSIFKNLPVITCSPYTFVGRKLIAACPSDSDQFTPKLELCPDELFSCESPGDIKIELRAKLGDGRLSNICIVSIDVQEKIPPVIIPVLNPEIRLDSDSMLFQLDTNIVIASLTDNSGIIASLVMTGSGIGATTGSGISFLDGSGFITFDCSLAGTYDVAIIATDCDNNSDTVVTQLSVDPDDLCAMPRPISGEIMLRNKYPMPGVQVNLSSGADILFQETDNQGNFIFLNDDLEHNSRITIEHNDLWTTGLTVMDLKLIQDYIIGLEQFNDWQLASADMDDSGTITIKDMLVIQNILLGLNFDVKEGAMPWLFSDSIKNGSYTDKYIYDMHPAADASLHIFSTKRGDVDGDNIVDSDTRSLAKLPVFVEPMDNYTSLYTIDLSLINNLSALQVVFNVKNGSIEKIHSPEGWTFQNQNQLTLLYYEHNKNQVESEIQVIVKHGYGVSPKIVVGNELKALWFDKNGARRDVEIELIESVSQSGTNDMVILASPNPTEDETMLFVRNGDKTEKEIAVILYNIQGKLIFQKTWNPAKVSDVFPLKLPTLPHNGLFLASVWIGNENHKVYIIKN